MNRETKENFRKAIKRAGSRTEMRWLHRLRTKWAAGTLTETDAMIASLNLMVACKRKGWDAE